jgi:hypothetical protein
MERGRRRRLRSSASEAGRLEVGGDADVRAPAASDCEREGGNGLAGMGRPKRDAREGEGEKASGPVR